MSERTDDAWDALEGDWHYLGRRVVDGFDIATLVPGPPAGGPSSGGGAEQRSPRGPAAGLPVAAAFTSRAAAGEFLAAAPERVELLSVPASDLRAKEEWLRALVDQGTQTLVFDPMPATLHSAAESRKAIAVHIALGYILSQRSGSACL